MPYVIVKTNVVRDEKTNSKLADDLFQAMQDSLGLDPSALTIDIQYTPREEWDAKVKSVEIEPRKDQMYYLGGQKQH
jgi:phenylpyruvate tautomerase PptA (4-oxalocrotonate tautomerase family)